MLSAFIYLMRCNYIRFMINAKAQENFLVKVVSIGFFICSRARYNYNYTDFKLLHPSKSQILFI